ARFLTMMWHSVRMEINSSKVCGSIFAPRAWISFLEYYDGHISGTQVRVVYSVKKKTYHLFDG
ncbi:MAG TPA: hypothetical protein VFG19_03895, partial [Geobacteraceae bacterium]|nr:hypothetical protein [Geobacteraceae bacterium]